MADMNRREFIGIAGGALIATQFPELPGANVAPALAAPVAALPAFNPAPGTWYGLRATYDAMSGALRLFVTEGRDGTEEREFDPGPYWQRREDGMLVLMPTEYHENGWFNWYLDQDSKSCEARMSVMLPEPKPTIHDTFKDFDVLAEVKVPHNYGYASNMELRVPVDQGGEVKFIL